MRVWKNYTFKHFLLKFQPMLQYTSKSWCSDTFWMYTSHYRQIAHVSYKFLSILFTFKRTKRFSFRKGIWFTGKRVVEGSFKFKESCELLIEQISWTGQKRDAPKTYTISGFPKGLFSKGFCFEDPLITKYNKWSLKPTCFDLLRVPAKFAFTNSISNKDQVGKLLSWKMS